MFSLAEEGEGAFTGGVGERRTGDRVGEDVLEEIVGGLITNPGLMERRLSRTDVTLRLPLEGTEREGVAERSSRATGRE